MHWTIENDKTAAVITAKGHIASGHGGQKHEKLPKTCVIFELGMAMGFLEQNYATEVLYERLPCFLEDNKCVRVKGKPDICFTRGGYGAPAAVDTLETVRALGAERIIVVGMCGGFGKNIEVGDVVIPLKVLSEEGTSRHYLNDISFVDPDTELFDKAVLYFNNRFSVTTDATVTTDAVYRQTFAKERYWRDMGCVGVDMEASALLAVGGFYSLPAVALLLCSDKHPLEADDRNWGWGSGDFNERRERFVRAAIDFSFIV